MSALTIAACAAAGAGGFFGYRAFNSRQMSKQRVRHLRKMAGDSMTLGSDLISTGLAHTIVARLQTMQAHSTMSASRAGDLLYGSGFRIPGEARIGARMRKLLTSAGMDPVMYRSASKGLMVQLCLLGLIVGALFGSMFTLAALIIFGMVGAVLGTVALPWALQQEAKARNHALELELPDMLDVVALGLRSGLTFDISFGLYAKYFDTPFSHECNSAYQRWSLGMATRADALNALADSYESPLFRSTVQGILQSIRLGSSLADDLGEAAQEARRAYQFKQEESVAKAPVKMMIPIGTMILPAMLLLVLGPVLLQLMSEM